MKAIYDVTVTPSDLTRGVKVETLSLIVGFAGLRVEDDTAVFSFEFDAADIHERSTKAADYDQLIEALIFGAPPPISARAETPLTLNAAWKAGAEGP
ncbi:hypothetical protein [Xanthobacter autotrophicus]|uniref:hypothetical protein n=1 Tax=Xanthobacter autotrophicus TaxID=280 RepID=UPI00372C9CD9